MLSNRQVPDIIRLVPDKVEMPELELAGVWAKRFFLASRALTESVLKEHGLGITQWYVLYLLSANGPVRQRDLAELLEIERATVSEVVAALARKGFVEQATDPHDQRQKLLQLTRAGIRLWSVLPNPIRIIADVAFGECDPADVEITRRVLTEATARLNAYREGTTT